MSPIKKGTKLTDNPKNRRLEMRLTQQQVEDIQECADKLNATKTEAVLKGIELLKTELDK